MEYRRLGHSGLMVPALTLGTGTFGGNTEMFKAWGTTDVEGARKLLDICLEHGLNMVDSGDVYSHGAAEEILGGAIQGRRDQLLISTKAAFRSGKGPNDVGASRIHLTDAVNKCLKRLGTDVIDLFQIHSFDAMTPVQETLQTLEMLIKQGKIRYIGCSNYSGWHLMKSLAASDQHGLPRFVAHQAYYSLVSREYEWELMPLALDQGLGTIVWSPLGWARLTGKIRRGQPIDPSSRMANKKNQIVSPPVEQEHLYNVVDALDVVAQETDKSVAQVALNWLLQRPSIASIIIGARNEAQLLQNLDVVNWKLAEAQIAKLDDASAVQRIYPYWHQEKLVERNPFPTK